MANTEKLVSQKEIDLEVGRVVRKIKRFGLSALKTKEYHNLTFNPFDNSGILDSDLDYLNLLNSSFYINGQFQENEVESRRYRFLVSLSPPFERTTRRTESYTLKQIRIKEYEIPEYVKLLMQIERGITDFGFKLSKLDFGKKYNKILSNEFSEEIFVEHLYNEDPYEVGVGEWPIFSKLYPIKIVTKKTLCSLQIQTSRGIVRPKPKEHTTKTTIFHLEQIVVPLSADTFSELKSMYSYDPKNFYFWTGSMERDASQKKPFVFKFEGKEYLS
jgi:hypothetical protein